MLVFLLEFLFEVVVFGFDSLFVIVVLLFDKLLLEEDCVFLLDVSVSWLEVFNS